MRKELEQKFQTRWPKWFRDLYGDVTQNCLHFGFQHRDGWFDLVWLMGDNRNARSYCLTPDIWRLCEQIEKVAGEGTPLKVAPVKEKFGGLRFSFECGNHAYHAIGTQIAAAEQESFHICEVCSQPGYLIGVGATECPG
jgi:hypothetical protein